MELLVRISCPAREPTKKLGEGADFSFPQFSGSDSGIGDPLISCSEDCSTKSGGDGANGGKFQDGGI